MTIKIRFFFFYLQVKKKEEEEESVKENSLQVFNLMNFLKFSFKGLILKTRNKYNEECVRVPQSYAVPRSVLAYTLLKEE